MGTPRVLLRIYRMTKADSFQVLGHVQSIFEMVRRVGQIPDRARLKDHKFNFNIYASCLSFQLEQSHYN